MDQLISRTTVIAISFQHNVKQLLNSRTMADKKLRPPLTYAVKQPLGTNNLT
jgi:hypothetical protein